MRDPAELFQALNSQRISSGGETWQIGVYSIQEEAGRLWIQLGADDGTGASLSIVVRAAPTNLAEEILERLREWLGCSDRDLIRTITVD